MKKEKQLENLYFSNYSAFVGEIVASAIRKTNFDKKKSQIKITPQKDNQRSAK